MSGESYVGRIPHVISFIPFPTVLFTSDSFLPVYYRKNAIGRTVIRLISFFWARRRRDYILKANILKAIYSHRKIS